MRLIAFSLVVACAWFVIANIATSLAAWWFTPAVLARVSGLDSTARAAAIFAWRLLPATASLAMSAGMAWPAFLIHESRGAHEPVTWWLGLALLVAAAIAATGARAVWRAWRDACARSAAWRAGGVVTADAVIVDQGLATAAVAGVWRPTVFVGRGLADLLTPGEWRAVVAHERAHATARDNVKRALLLATPDLLRFTRRGDALSEAWVQATEQSADDRVAALGRGVAIDLAGALVKAARVVTGEGPSLAPALVRNVADGDLAGRVVRLLAAPGGGRRSALVAALARGGLAVVLAAPLVATPVLSPRLHAISEFLVNARF